MTFINNASDSSASSSGHIWWSGICCCRSIDVELTVGNVYVTLPTALLFLAVFSKHSSSQSTNVCSTLEALVRMCYLNHVTLHIFCSCFFLYR